MNLVAAAGSPTTRSPIRRAVLLCAALLLSAVGYAQPAHARYTAMAAPAGSPAAPAVRLTLPPPTGPDRVGVVPLHLIDRSRPDPWVPARPVRELMVSLWYPARHNGGRARLAWLPPAAFASFEQDIIEVPPGTLRVPLTSGRLTAPVDRRAGGHPVVVYSPGLGANRDSSTVLVEHLVSRGYIVVTIDHTYDSSQVEFPDGRLAVATMPPITSEVLARAVDVRAADVRFVIDQLDTLNAGRNPDAGHRPLPHGLRGALNLSRIGMFGHSLGGATAAAVMFEDRRVRAGVNMDGAMWGPVVDAGLDRPFLLVSSQVHGRDNDESWVRFWAALRGWRLNLRLVGSGHNSFNDFQVLVPQMAGPVGIPPEDVVRLIGTIDPRRSILNQTAYLAAFVDLHLRSRDNHLLDGPSPRFPEMEFVP